VIQGAQPFALELLSQSTLLQPSEQLHVLRLRETPGALPALLQERTLGMRLRDQLTSAPPYEPPPHPDEVDVLRLARAKDPAGHRLYDVLESESTLHLALARATFAHHDRHLSRKGRWRNVRRGFALVILSFIIDAIGSNM